MAFERIMVDPNKMAGLPCIRDLRMTVSAYGAAAVRERELPLTKPA